MQFTRRSSKVCARASAVNWPAPDGVRNRVVETAVERPKLIRGDGNGPFDSQRRNGLTHIPIVVHDLINGEPAPQQFSAMERGRAPDGRRGRRGLCIAIPSCGGLLGFEGFSQLFEK